MEKEGEEMLYRQLRSRRSIALLISFVLLLVAGLSLSTAAQELAEISVVLKSFQRLGMLNPDIAGQVWMSETVYEDWHELTEQTDDSSTGRAVWFIHAVPLAAVTDAGIPYGGIYSPWLGTLLLFELDNQISTITGFTMEHVADPVLAGSDPIDLAVQLMDSIRVGSASFEQAVGTPLAAETSQAVRTELAARVDDHAVGLQPLLQAGSSESLAVETILNDIAAGRFLDPLSLLRAEDEEWLASLVPVTFAESGTGSVVVLASSVDANKLAWIVFAAGFEVESVSLIQLFDGVTTRGGEST